MTSLLESLNRTATSLALAVCVSAVSAFAWTASGTVKSSNGGAVLSGVSVTVKDSASYTTTTSATGTFTLSSPTGVHGSASRSALSVRVAQGQLEILTPIDGPMDLSLVDASGRSLWGARVVASQGKALVVSPELRGLRAIFLRVRHSGGVEYFPVRSTGEGASLGVSQAAARAQAAFPTLVFKKTGYRDTTYVLTSESATGFTVTMAEITTCDLPSTFKWKDNGAPLAGPKNGWTAIKDFTHVAYNGKHYVYMTYYLNGWNSAQMAPFTNWSDAAAATQTKTNTGVAPEVMYFTPKKTWIMSKQWCAGASFCWMESTNLDNGNSFVQKGNLLTETITDDKKAPIDQVVICDDDKCYLFYADDNGRIYRGSMPKANFPGTFSGTTKILQDTQARLFEAVEVYKIKGQKKYLMIVECMSPRYFRAFTATDLGGTWTSLVGADTQAKPFAGKNNVTGGWSDDISHGDIVRSTYDEYREIDPCNLQLLYQGYKGPFSGEYGNIPYQLGLLNAIK